MNMSQKYNLQTHQGCKNIVLICKNLDSIKSDCSLTGKLQKKHEHQDDQKWMEHGFLEDISESELGVRMHILQNLRVQGDQGVEVILVQRQQVLGGHGYKTNI